VAVKTGPFVSAGPVAGKSVGSTWSLVGLIPPGIIVISAVLIVIVESRGGNVGIAPHEDRRATMKDPQSTFAKYLIKTRLLIRIEESLSTTHSYSASFLPTFIDYEPDCPERIDYNPVSMLQSIRSFQAFIGSI
jgi:hypothetical protein